VEIRAFSQEPVDQFGAGLNQMFAIVKHQQRLAPVHVAHQSLEWCMVGRLVASNRSEHDNRYDRPIDDHRQVDKPDAIWEVSQ
jgi:hypothetical protein